MARSFLLPGVLFGLLTCATAAVGREPPALKTVPHVDLKRYLGTWYEIARYPLSFEKGCTGVTATYAPGEGGELSVENRCHKGSLDGPLKVSRGRARVVDKTSDAKLQVSFFWPFWGDYWIIDLGPNYDYAVVSDPGREHLWILSRSPTMDPRLYQAILARLEAQGFDLSRLERTPQLPKGPAT